MKKDEQEAYIFISIIVIAFFVFAIFAVNTDYKVKMHAIDSGMEIIIN